MRLFLLASSASACTVCYSDRSAQVRAAVFGPDFWLNGACMVLPFIVLAPVVAVLYYGLPARNKGQSA